MIELENQLYVIIQSLFFGCFLEVIYEIHSSLVFLLGLRGTRVKLGFIKRKIEAKKGKFKTFIIGVFDFFYFVSITPACAIFLYGVNNGILRWYIFLSWLIGFGMFKISAGRIINYILDSVCCIFGQYVIGNVKIVCKYVRSKILVKRKPKKENKRRVIVATNGKQG